MKKEHLGITKAQFDAYVKVQQRGLYNMVMDGPSAMRAARLDPVTYWSIICNYGALRSAFYGKEAAK